MTQRERNQVADVYAAISASGTGGLTAQSLRDAGHMTASFAIEHLKAQRMIVRLVGNGICVDGRYVTVRNAR